MFESFQWALQNMGRGCGIARNPNTEVGIEREPETVQELIGRHATEEVHQ